MSKKNPEYDFRKAVPQRFGQSTVAQRAADAPTPMRRMHDYHRDLSDGVFAVVVAD